MNVLTLAGRELRSSFNGALGWLVLAGFLLITGLFWGAMVSWYALQSTEVVATPYGGPQLGYTEYLLLPYFSNMALLVLLVAPLISMRLFSEELRARTLELLLTSPVTTLEIVLGKYLGALGFVAAMLMATLASPGMLLAWGTPDVGVLLAGYLGVFLVGASVLAMGMLFSSLTSSQVVAGVWTFTGAMGLWVLDWTGWEPLTQWALLTHTQDLLRGIVRLSDLVYFGGFIGFFVFATWQRLESFRWS